MKLFEPSAVRWDHCPRCNRERRFIFLPKRFLWAPLALSLKSVIGHSRMQQDTVLLMGIPSPPHNREAGYSVGSRVPPCKYASISRLT